MRVENNKFPYVTATPGAAPAAPDSGDVRLFVDVADGLLKIEDDASAVTVVGAGVADITDIPTAETDVTLALHPDGIGGVEWGTDATGGGGGGALPSIVQFKETGPGASNSTTLDQAPADGATLIAFIDVYNSATIAAITQTGATWTKLDTVTNGGGAIYDLWVGVVSTGGGTVITHTNANAALSAVFIELADVLTPTLGTHGSTDTSGTTQSWMTLVAGVAAITAGHLVVFACGPDNTTSPNGAMLNPSIPTVGLSGRIAIRVGYAEGNPVYCGAFLAESGSSSHWDLLIAEIT